MIGAKIRKDFRLPPPLVRWIQQHAAKNKLTETAIVETALVNYKQMIKKEPARAKRPAKPR